MGKTRSSRRMRNCKSRTKRGGTWSGFQSDLLTNFKSAVRRGVTKPSYDMFDQNPTAGVTVDVINQIGKDLLNYNSVTDMTLKHFVLDQHNGLGECNTTKVSELKSQINDDSPKRKAYYMHVLNNICKIPTEQAAQPDSQVPPPTGLAGEYTQSRGQPGQAGQVPIPSGQPGQPGTVVDSLGAPPNVVLAPKWKPGGFRPPKDGGKSRRRHRRGRTLHKRRKSSKVRKMRYSRTRR